MKVKTTILAPLFLWIGFFPVYADESMAESIIVQQQVKVHGAVVGMSLSTTTDEIFAAILESLAYQFAPVASSCVTHTLVACEL